MIRRFAAATLLLLFVVSLQWNQPLEAQGTPTPTNTPRDTPTPETETPTPTPVTPTATATSTSPVATPTSTATTTLPTTTSTPPASATQPPTTGGSPQSNGSIRGTVFEDKNNDGKCTGQGEPTLAGIVIQFVSNDGQTTVFLESGSDGSFGLVAAGLGTWSVKAVPPAGYSVSSAETRSVVLSETQRVATGVDFCIRKGAAAPGPSVLPASGSPIATPILGMTFTGIAFIAAGLFWQARHLWLKRR